jgi:hypothetical protein
MKRPFHPATETAISAVILFPDYCVTGNLPEIPCRLLVQERSSATALMPARSMAGRLREPDGQRAQHRNEYRQGQNDNR